MKSQGASDQLARTVAVNAITIGQVFYLLNSRYPAGFLALVQGASWQQVSAARHRRGRGVATAVHLRAAAAATVRQRSHPALGLAVAVRGRPRVLPRGRGGKADHSLSGLFAAHRYRGRSGRVKVLSLTSGSCEMLLSRVIRGRSHERQTELTPRKSKLKRKIYEKELRKLQVQLCRLAGLGEAQGIARHHRVRGARCRRQGRHHQGDHRAGEPARISRCCAAGAFRSGKDADVFPALHPAFSRRRRGHHLRSQLVQPRRRRVRDGVLHRGGASAIS